MSGKDTFELSRLKSVDGSCVLESGATRVICSVAGPIEAKSRQEMPTQAAVEVIVRPSVGLPTTREHLLEQKLCAITASMILKERYPRSLIQIVVQFLETGEITEFTMREFTAALNSIYLALINANIPLKVSFAAVLISLIPGSEDEKSGTKLVVNPSQKEMSASSSIHCVAYEIRDGQSSRILFCESTGTFTEEELLLVLDEAAMKAQKFHKRARKAIADSINKELVWRDE